MTQFVTKAGAVGALDLRACDPLFRAAPILYRLPGGLPLRGGAGTGGSDSHYFLARDGDARAAFSVTYAGERLTPGGSLEHDERHRGVRVPADMAEPAAGVVYNCGGFPVRLAAGMDSVSAEALADWLRLMFPGEAFTVATGETLERAGIARPGFHLDQCESVETRRKLEAVRRRPAFYVTRDGSGSRREIVDSVEIGGDATAAAFPSPEAARAEAQRLRGEYAMADRSALYSVSALPDSATVAEIMEGEAV